MITLLNSRWMTAGLAIGLVLSPKAWAQPAQVKKAHVRVEIVAEKRSFQPGETFWVGVHAEMDPGWHIYWRNPGDSGLATSVRWELPDGVKADELLWPIPEVIVSSGLTTYAYKNEVVLPTRVHVPDDFAGSTLPLIAHVSWLACEKECIPGKGIVGVTLPRGTGTAAEAADTVAQRLLNRFLASVPQPWPGETVVFDKRPEGFVLRLSSVTAYLPPHFSSIREAYFFPYRDDVLDHNARQTMRLQNDSVILEWQPSPFLDHVPDVLEGVIVLVSSRSQVAPQGFEIQAVRGDVEDDFTMDAASSPSASWPMMALLAFVGGLILNLMPCVFPVLSLKVIHLVHQGGESFSRRGGNALAYTGGIVISFWALAAVLIVLRQTGQEIGWGFQFQSPVFLVAMSFLFFLLALNLWGLWEVRVFLPPLWAETAQGSQGAVSAFLSGILATIVATPCTAPFMGTAIGFAMGQPSSVAWIVFTFLGLGMAAPVALLTFLPQGLRFLPRPGPWMVRLKMGFGFLLMAVVLWLLSVFSLSKGAGGMVLLCFALWSLGIGIWLWPMVRESRTRLGRLGAGLACLLALMGSLALAMASIKTVHQADDVELTSPQEDLVWQKYSPERIEKLRAQKRPFFLDFTAAWCLSCQVNERAVLSHPKVREAFRQKGIVLVKADWTTHDETITRALARYGKNSIPLYVLSYGGDAEQDKILPEILTVPMMLKAMEPVPSTERSPL